MREVSLKNIEKLGPEPRYFPIEKGVYELGPGLRPLGFDLGRGHWDQKTFQIGPEFAKYRGNKLECRQENPSKYLVQKDLGASTKLSISLLILRKLQTEYPDLFLEETVTLGQRLFCTHTGDQAIFDKEWRLVQFQWGFENQTGAMANALDEQPKAQAIPAPVDLLDFLSFQVPEDLVLVSASSDKSKDWLSYLNVCSPTHWSPEEKLGQSFLQVHAPVPGIEKLLRSSSQLTEAMITKGPYVRFVWSFVTDTRLNHHPVAPTGEDPVWWKGRSFDQTKSEPFYFRAERQTTWGFPEFNTALFLIRISFFSATEIRADEKKKAQLLSALQSMTPESRAYKGVAHCFDQLCSWLNSTDAK